jgi:hypothetical protein
MGLGRESAEDIEHPTEFLLETHSHVVELVEQRLNHFLPCMEVAHRQIHLKVTQYASPDEARWCSRLTVGRTACISRICM